MKLILVPDWIEQHLKLHGKTIGSLVTDQIRSTLSVRDMAFYSFLSERFSDLLVDTIREDWNIHTDCNVAEADYQVYYQAKREFVDTYSYEFNVAKLVELCGSDCLGMSSDDSEVKRDCILGFDVIACIEDNFFVKAKEVDAVGYLQSLDQLFTELDKTFSIERIANMATFKNYQVRLNDLVKSGSVVD